MENKCKTKLTTGVLEKLAADYERKSKHGDRRMTDFSRAVALETAEAIRELLQLRKTARVRLEGTVS